MEIGTTLFDSKNSAKMSFYTDYQDSDKLKAIVYDESRGKSHAYFVSIYNDKTIFKYSHSNKYIADNFSDENPYSIDIAKIDDVNFKIDVYVYTNNKKTKKKIKVTAIATLEKSDFEYYVIHADFFSSNYIKSQILEMMPKDSKYYIKKVIIEYVGSKKYSLVNEVETSDITLLIPTQN